MRLLRRMKAEAALLIALADIGGVWPVMRVTAALTALADTAVGAAVRHLLARCGARGRLTSRRSARSRKHGSGYIVLAMGKMGAFELNYSSDIDLIVFYDPARPALPPDTEPAPFFVRLTRRLVKLLQERTADGYVFRVDLRLRPDPASTQIAVSTAAALDYYESVGQNWERAAMIKARPCAGDIAAGEAFLAELSPFIWRKYLDFAAIADIHAMKRQIHAYRGHGEIAVEGHNIKLGRGGIREIEFFVQTQQLIAGGRHPELRGRGTLAMLAALAKGGWISSEPATILAAAYRFLRTVEHRLQMVADEQTHTLPGDREALERFARFLGFADRDAFAEALLAASAQGAAPLRRPVRGAPRQTPRSRRCIFPPRPTTAKRSTSSPPWAFASRWKSPRWCAAGWPAATARCGAAFARAQLAELVPLLLDAVRALRRIRTRRCSPSTASSPACTAAAGCSRCCGRIPISSPDRAGARHRAAARRQPGAVSRSDGCGDRSELLRRAAGGGGARRRASTARCSRPPATRTFSIASASSPRSTCS